MSIIIAEVSNEETKRISEKKYEEIRLRTEASHDMFNIKCLNENVLKCLNNVFNITSLQINVLISLENVFKIICLYNDLMSSCTNMHNCVCEYECRSVHS